MTTDRAPSTPDLDRVIRLLDDDVQARALLTEAAAAAGTPLLEAHRRSLHRRGARSVSHVFEAVLDTPEGTRSVLLVAHADARGLPDTALVLGRGADRVAVWRFPNDPYLPGLPSAVDRRRVRELLDALDGPDGAVQLRTRAYRPSRRAVVEVTVTDGGAAQGRVLYLKVLAGGRAEELAAVHRALRPRIPVPRVIGTSPSQGMLALEALGGATLRAALVGGAALPEPDELVALSRRLAEQPVVSRRDPTAFADPTRHVGLLTTLVPGLADRLTALAAAVAVPGGPRGPVHGDLHDGQLLVTDGRVTGVLDVDGVGEGHLASDAGSLVAHLQAVGHVWPAHAARAEDYAAAVADAYRGLVGDLPLRRGIAAAWLALATGPNRAQDPDWRDETQRRVERALAVPLD